MIELFCDKINFSHVESNLYLRLALCVAVMGDVKHQNGRLDRPVTERGKHVQYCAMRIFLGRGGRGVGDGAHWERGRCKDVHVGVLTYVSNHSRPSVFDNERRFCRPTSNYAEQQSGALKDDASTVL